EITPADSARPDGPPAASSGPGGPGRGPPRTSVMESRNRSLPHGARAMLVPLADVEEARRHVAASALRTPLVRLNAPDAPADIRLKLENLQPIGSFKIRGAANALAHVPPDRLRRGVLTASAGNMAQGVAYRARELGVPCTVVAPDTAPAVKVAA